MTASPFDDIKALIAGLPEAPAPRIEADPALGRLGRIAASLSRWQAGPGLRIGRPIIALYAGGHPGVSPDLARARLEAIAAGGAPVNALARSAGAGLEAFDLAIEQPVGDMALRPAMTERECAATMAFGMEALAKQPDLLVVGSVGPGGEASHATAAAALFAWTDPDPVVALRAIERLGLQAGLSPEPLEILRQLGGRETAAMAGAILAARSQGVAVLLDGYGAAVAAAILEAIDPGAIEHVQAADVSPGGHARLLQALGLEPVLDLGLCAGDGAGGAAALAVIRLACALG